MKADRVSYLEEEEAKALIDEPIRINDESRYLPAAIDHIYDLTAGSPFYIQIFCDKLVDYVNDKRVMKITKSIVKKVLEVHLMELDKGLFDNLINDGDPSPDAIKDQDAETVLREIAKFTKNDYYCNPNQFKITTITAHNQTLILKNLLEREVIATNKDGLYRIRVELFKEWLNVKPI